MCVCDVKGQLSALFHVCEDDVEGGSQSVRENVRLLRSSLKGETGQVY